MQKELNLKIKFRESFRPFAPIVLKDSYKEWFEDVGEGSPYMGDNKASAYNTMMDKNNSILI